MEIGKYPEYYRTSRIPDISAGQRGSPAFAGMVSDSSPQVDPGVKSDVFEARQAVDKIKQLDKIAPDNPFTATAAIPPMERENRPSPVIDFLKSPEGKTAMAVGGIIPMIRRDQSAINKYEQGNNIGAGLAVAMGLTNMPGDWREMANAGGEGRKILNALGSGNLKELKNIFATKGQHEMTLLRGTILEPLVNKFGWLKKLNDFDDTLYNTRFGKFVRKFFNISKDHSKTEYIKREGFKNPFSGKTATPIVKSIPAFQFTGNYFQQLTGRILQRISKLSLVTSALIEVPALVKSVTKTEGSAFDKAKAFGKQLIKSAGFVSFVSMGIAAAGAVLATHTFIGALVGMAIGSTIGIMASNSLNKQVDKMFS